MEATLALREEALLQVLQALQQAVEQDTGQDLACYRQEGYSSAVIACLAIALPLIDVRDCPIPEFLLLVSHRLEQACQLTMNGFATCLVYLSWNGVGA